MSGHQVNPAWTPASEPPKSACKVLGWVGGMDGGCCPMEFDPESGFVDEAGKPIEGVTFWMRIP